MPSKLRQRQIARGNIPSGATTFTRMKTAMMAMNPNSAPSASDLSYLSYVYFSSTQVYPSFDVTPADGLALTINNLITNTHALNPNTKFGVYAMATDFASEQWGFVASFSRSGSTLTLTSRNMENTADRNWSSAGYSAGVSVCVQGFTGSDAVYNGTYAGANVSVSGATMTITGVSTSGSTSGSDVNIFVATSNTAFYGLMQKCDEPSFWMRKYGPTSQTARIHCWSTSFFTPTMNISSYCDTNSEGKQYAQVVSEFYSANLLNIIGTGSGQANDGIQFIFWDNVFDKYKDVKNDNPRTFGGNSGSSFRDYGNVTQSSTWQDITTLYEDTVGSDSTAINAYRDGFGAVCNHMDNALGSRTKSTGVQEHIGNHDTQSGTKILPGNFNGKLDGILLENVVASVSDATRGASGTQFSLFNTASIYYNTSGTGVLQVAPGRLRGNKIVIMGAEPTNYTQYETIRFINALAAIADGNMMAAIHAQSGTWQLYPEQKAGRGAAIDPAPTSYYTGTVLKRAYENMLVLINMGNSTSPSMDFTGQGWFAIDSTTDSTVNNGAALTTVSLPAWTARFYVKLQDAGIL